MQIKSAFAGRMLKWVKVRFLKKKNCVWVYSQFRTSNFPLSAWTWAASKMVRFEFFQNVYYDILSGISIWKYIRKYKLWYFCCLRVTSNSKGNVFKRQIWTTNTNFLKNFSFPLQWLNLIFQRWMKRYLTCYTSNFFTK